MANVMLTNFGVVVNEGDIIGHSFIIETVKKNTLIRELSAAGIFYNQEETLFVKLRTYLTGSAVALLKSSGATIHSEVIDFDNIAHEEPEDDEEATEASANPNAYSIFYVESDISTSSLGEHRMSLLSLPSYVKKCANPKNQEILDKKIRIYSKAVELMGSPLSLEPMLEDDDDDGLTGGRLTDNAKEAQFEAHRAQQAELRNRAVAVLDFMEERFFNADEEVEVIPLPVAVERFKDMQVEVDGEEVPLVSFTTLSHDLAEAVKAI